MHRVTARGSGAQVWLDIRAAEAAVWQRGTQALVSRRRLLRRPRDNAYRKDVFGVSELLSMLYTLTM